MLTPSSGFAPVKFMSSAYAWFGWGASALKPAGSVMQKDFCGSAVSLPQPSALAAALSDPASPPLSPLLLHATTIDVARQSPITHPAAITLDMRRTLPRPL